MATDRLNLDLPVTSIHGYGDVKVFGHDTPLAAIQGTKKPCLAPCSVNKPGCDSRMRECRRRYQNRTPVQKPAGVEGVVDPLALEPCGSGSALEECQQPEEYYPTGPKLPERRHLRTGDPNVHLTEEGFDFLYPDDGVSEPEVVMMYTWTTRSRMTVKVITYGATVVGISVPDARGMVQDVLLGFDDLAGYRRQSNPYIGATLGRVANYIENANYKYLHDEYDLRPNRPPHHFNGGRRGFDKKLWTATQDGTKIIMNLVSESGAEGYPGKLLTSITFQVTAENRFIVSMRSASDCSTPVSLTHALRLNLAGHAAGLLDIFKHRVTVDADKYVEKNFMGLPTGKLLKVAATQYDFRVERNIGGLLRRCARRGIDHTLCLTHQPEPKEDEDDEDNVIFVARILHPDSGRVLEIYSNQPGLNFSTCNDLPDHGYDLLPEDPDDKENVYLRPVDTVNEYTQVIEDDIDFEMFPEDDEEEEEEDMAKAHVEGDLSEAELNLSPSEIEARLAFRKQSAAAKKSDVYQRISLITKKGIEAKSSVEATAEEQLVPVKIQRKVSDPDAGGAEWWGKTPPGAEDLYESAREARMKALKGFDETSEHGAACSKDCPCRLTEDQRLK
ncbi:uncharacterized protein LOC113389663 [Ctenocephalides felis]|uniref:uncharacterized protein LOC113389663 n=1 Tax=Ctenocephalides felis TaxID=7515 RepID=UPI000E6E52C6|nr:uncharacterized protein LOC113389663 [Ctenocephalides felis]